MDRQSGCVDGLLILERISTGLVSDGDPRRNWDTRSIFLKAIETRSTVLLAKGDIFYLAHTRHFKKTGFSPDAFLRLHYQLPQRYETQMLLLLWRQNLHPLHLGHVSLAG